MMGIRVSRKKKKKKKHLVLHDQILQFRGVYIVIH